MGLFGSLIGLPSRLAADGLEELQAAAWLVAFAVAGRMEDQARAVIALAERVDAASAAVAAPATGILDLVRGALGRVPGLPGGAQRES